MVYGQLRCSCARSGHARRRQRQRRELNCIPPERPRVSRASRTARRLDGHLEISVRSPPRRLFRHPVANVSRAQRCARRIKSPSPSPPTRLGVSGGTVTVDAFQTKRANAEAAKTKCCNCMPTPRSDWQVPGEPMQPDLGAEGISESVAVSGLCRHGRPRGQRSRCRRRDPPCLTAWFRSCRISPRSTRR